MKNIDTVKKVRFSRRQFLSFVLLFALVGSYFLYKSFAAAPLVASMEGEQMVLPAGASVITDNSASSGKAVQLSANGTANGSVNFPSSVTSLTIIARGDQCSGAPNITVLLDGINYLSNASVSSASWTSYSVTPSAAIASGTHNLSVSFTNDYSYAGKGHGNSGKTSGACDRNLYVDVTNFYGPSVTTPIPTVTLSASPTSLSAGASATLTWASTNATSCTASGSWSGSEPTSGSVSTGALNQSSTYSLTCTGAGGSASASAEVMVSASLAVSSSLQNNATISGTYPWVITTNVPEGQVEYFFENASLGKVSGSTSFTYNLDTTKYSNAAHNGGYWVYDASGAVVYKSPSINFSINNTGGSTGTGTLIKFGSFDLGNLSEFSDATCNPGNVSVHSGGGPNNTNWARYAATSSTQCYGDTANIRIHSLGIPGGSPSWLNNGGTTWEAISLRVPSGYTNGNNTSDGLYAGPEIHGDNGTGPAPFNATADNGYWLFRIRGSNYTIPNPSGGYPFAQYTLGGPAPSGLYDGQYYRRWQAWNGGNHTVVPNEWVHFRLGFHFDTTDNNGAGNGWFEAWARWGNMTSWVNIVPRINSIPLGYPDTSGDGSALYPMLSMYRPTSGASGTYALDYADGAWSNDYTSLVNWQNSRLGF